MRLFARCAAVLALVACVAMTPAPVFAEASGGPQEAVTQTADSVDAADGNSTPTESTDEADELAAQEAALAYLRSSLPGRNRGILPQGLDSADARFVGLARLARADVDLDATLVSFTGEVVGEPVKSATEGRRWITMLSVGDSTSSIGVLMDEDQIGLIENFGAYKVKGTTLLVTGIYHVADAGETGALDVVAYEVRVVDEGGAVPEPLSQGKLLMGISLTLLGAVIVAVGIYRKRRVRS